MNKMFNTKVKDMKVYKCHVNASERLLGIGHRTREYWVLGICSVGPVYLNEANQLLIR